MKEAALLVAAVIAAGVISVSMGVQQTSVPQVAAVPTVAAQVPTGSVPRRALPTPLPVPTVQSMGDRFTGLLATAESWLGVPYLWGGCSKAGIDCSCFVRNVLAVVGINAPRVTYQQIAWTRPVVIADARPFDLVFFDNTCTDCGPNPTHVGIYIGGGQMIQAGGAAVSVQPAFTGWYGQHSPRVGRVP